MKKTPIIKLDGTRTKNFNLIRIPITENQPFHKIQTLELDLLDKGISFDTGTDLSVRDWFIDWSLKGATPEFITDYLKKKKIKFFIGD